MTFGFEGKNGVRTSSLTECQEILDVFFDHGHTELDTARMYAEGTTEQVASQYSIQWELCFSYNPRLVSFYLNSISKVHQSIPSHVAHLLCICDG